MELYDLEKDPHEQVNLAKRETSQTRRMVEMIESWLSTLGPAPKGGPITVPSNSQLEAELEALGYIDR